MISARLPVVVTLALLFSVGCGPEGELSLVDEQTGDAASSDAADADGQQQVRQDGGWLDQDVGGAETSDAADAGSEPRDTGSTVVDTGATPDVSPPEDMASPQPVCGDGVVEAGEACDDGNKSGNDGCNANCGVEAGYNCNASQPSVCTIAPSPGTGDGKCEASYGAGVYDPYPGSNGGYPKGDSDRYGWPGEDFESYANNELVEASSNKGRRPHIDVTSGSLTARHLSGSQLWKRGQTTTYNFRVLTRATAGGERVRFTDAEMRARVYFDAWHSTNPSFTGAHIFARYQTENDLYVASLRRDGKVVIKLKHCDKYTTLAVANFSEGAVQTGKWYDLRFEVVGQFLRFWVNGKLEVEAMDDTLSWGTTGIRTDYANLYFDDWEHR